MDAASGAQVSTVRGAPKRALGWARAGVRLFILSLIRLGYVFAFQAISGLSSGTFIPLAIGFVVQNLPAQLVIYGVAAYSLNLELSLNIAASIEG